MRHGYCFVVSTDILVFYFSHMSSVSEYLLGGDRFTRIFIINKSSPAVLERFGQLMRTAMLLCHASLLGQNGWITIMLLLGSCLFVWLFLDHLCGSLPVCWNGRKWGISAKWSLPAEACSGELSWWHFFLRWGFLWKKTFWVGFFFVVMRMELISNYLTIVRYLDVLEIKASPPPPVRGPFFSVNYVFSFVFPIGYEDSKAM